MNILLVNDDGIDAPGLHALVRALHKRHTLTVVAPGEECSGFSQKLTMHTPLTIEPRSLKEAPEIPAFAILDGSPADCTKLGMELLCMEKPDLVVSGINNGYNVGTDICYSGTFGAAMEAAMNGYPAIAVSQKMARIKEDYFAAAGFAVGFIDAVDIETLPPRCVININYPWQERRLPKGILITRQGRAHYDVPYDECEPDEQGRRRVRIGSNASITIESGEPDTDIWAVMNGYISITPLHFDRTSQDALQGMQRYAHLQFGKD